MCCRWEPTALRSDSVSSFVHVSVGGQTTCAADVSGKVHTWGFGGSNKLGHASTNNELVPRVLHSLASVFVSRVTCGHLHMAAVTSVGTIYTWGDGEFGKLGHGNCIQIRACGVLTTLFDTGNVDSVSIPTLCRHMREPIVDIACGKDHTLALSSTGSLFAWGSNKDGRLGLGHTQTLYEPNRCSAFNVKICALRDDSFHCFVCSIPLQGLVATCVAAGWDHSGAVIDGSVYTWGRGVKGQLGDGEGKSRKQAGCPVAIRSILTHARPAVARFASGRRRPHVSKRTMWQVTPVVFLFNFST